MRENDTEAMKSVYLCVIYARVGYAQLINAFRRHASGKQIKNTPSIHGIRIMKQLLASINPSIIETTRFGLFFLLTCRLRNFS